MKAVSPLVIWSLVILAVLDGGDLFARAFTIQGPTYLKSLETARPGDIVTLKNGNWLNATISVNKGGSLGKPVEIRAESPGGVILGGSSSLHINAPFVTVDGLFFHKGALAQGSVIQFNSHHGIVRNTAIVDYNPASFETNYYWAFFSGDSNLIDRCYFRGKNHLEPVIGNALEGSRHNGVVRSYFKDIPYAEANGREILRIWGSGKFEERDEDGAFFTIEGNLFDHADGEGTEIISLKSNHNQVLRNTVVGTRGGINIRRGNYNTVKDNIILGEGLAGAHGLRMSGEHNIVQGNYVSRCDYGIRVSCGELIDSDLTGSYEPHSKRKAERGMIATYPQVKDLTLSDNVTVGISGADLEIGSAYKKHWPKSQQVLIPEECLIKNNRFVRPKGGDSVVGTIPDSSPPLDRFKFKPNQYLGNLLIGGRNAFASAAKGFQVQHYPGGWSAAQEAIKFKPLTPADVGPEWVRARQR